MGAPSLNDVNAAGNAIHGVDPHALRVEITPDARSEWKDQAALAFQHLKNAMDKAAGLKVDPGGVTIPFQSATQTADAINHSGAAVNAGITANYEAAENLWNLIDTALNKLEQQAGGQ